MSDSIEIKRSTFIYVLAGLAVLGSFAAVKYTSSPFILPFVMSSFLVGWAAYYTYSNKQQLSEMCCMMSGMVFGMISGFFIGTLAALMTSDFLIGIVAGTIGGLVVGIPMGRIGNGKHLGRMEGVMAGPMGGMMGGMLGIMIRFYNIELFMPFLILIIILTVWEMVYVIYKHVGKISSKVVWVGILASVLALVFSITADYSDYGSGTGLETIDAIQEGSSQALLRDGFQEIDMTIGKFSYSPDYIVVKKGIPVRINLKADADAGCTRSIVFPDFGISKIVPAGGTDTIEFTPNKAGTYQFRCSMNMARGTLVVQ